MLLDLAIQCLCKLSVKAFRRVRAGGIYASLERSICLTEVDSRRWDEASIFIEYFLCLWSRPCRAIARSNPPPRSFLCCVLSSKLRFLLSLILALDALLLGTLLRLELVCDRSLLLFLLLLELFNLRFKRSLFRYIGAAHFQLFLSDLNVVFASHIG